MPAGPLTLFQKKIESVDFWLKSALFFYRALVQDISFFQLTWYMFPVGWIMTFILRILSIRYTCECNTDDCHRIYSLRALADDGHAGIDRGVMSVITARRVVGLLYLRYE